MLCLTFFFFQAEDGIRDHCVTGVQTCALPIWMNPPKQPCRAGLTTPLRETIVSLPETLPSLIITAPLFGRIHPVCLLALPPPTSSSSAPPRSEERRVGKECRSRCVSEQ